MPEYLEEFDRNYYFSGEKYFQGRYILYLCGVIGYLCSLFYHWTFSWTMGVIGYTTIFYMERFMYIKEGVNQKAIYKILRDTPIGVWEIFKVRMKYLRKFSLKYIFLTILGDTLYLVGTGSHQWMETAERFLLGLAIIIITGTVVCLPRSRR